MANNTDVSTRRRVKLYMLNGERQWDDKGTGHVSATLVENNSMALVVISETDGSHLLESKILNDTAYQKQQETLIVWSDGDSVDLALSFQEKTGCDDIWEKICNVQGKDPSVEITQELADETDDGEDLEDSNTSNGTIQGLDFPSCDLNHLGEISERFTQVVNFPIQRDRFATTLERSQYIRQLIDLFHKAEDLGDITSLHHLYEITRAILQFNKRSLYDMLFSDDYLMDIVGMLEYNPSKRVKHREFIIKKSNFKEIVPISAALKAKIHQTYRIQYIQDNCLPPPSLFDDNASANLNTLIYMNKIEIITKLQDDSQFLPQIFNKLLQPDILVDVRIDLLGLLKEFCTIVNTLQLPQKESFFNTLSEHRALKAIFYSFTNINDRIQSLCVDILQIFVENQPSVVRDFFVNDSNSENLCINLLIDHLISDLDPELSTGFLIVNMLKVLVEPENMVTNQRNEKSEFLAFFYRKCMLHLVQPLLDLTCDNELKYDDYHTAMVMHEILELLAFCVESHPFQMKSFALYNNLLHHVVTLFKSKHKFVVLAAVRVVRKFIASKEELLIRYIVKYNLLFNVAQLLDQNPQYNMLNSAILELFEYIRHENISALVASAVSNECWAILEKHNYVSIFNNLQLLNSKNPINTEQSLSGNQLSSANSTISMLSGINPIIQGSANNILSNNISRITNRRELRSLEDDDDERWYDQDADDDEIDGTNAASSSYNEDSSIYSAAHQSTFIERTQTKCSGDDGSNDSLVDSTDNLKLNPSSRFNREPISINIKSTSLVFGNHKVSSTTTTTNVDNNDVEENFMDTKVDESKLRLNTNNSNISPHNSIEDNKTIGSQKSSLNGTKGHNLDNEGATDSVPTILTGLVDYDDDDEEDGDIYDTQTTKSTTQASITTSPSSDSKHDENTDISNDKTSSLTSEEQVITSSVISEDKNNPIDNDSDYVPSSKKIKTE